MSTEKIYILPIVAVCILLSIFAVIARANPSTDQATIIPAPPQLAASAYIVIDANSGRILVEHNADKRIPPASITKLMTSYIVASEIAQGKIGLRDAVNISEKAWRKGGSKMFVKVGDRVAVEDLMRGMIIQSGNDASIALAEHVAGGEDAFVDIMNQQAALIGLNNTQFRNVTGWPAQGHYSSARDIALLAQAYVRDFPTSYAYYSEKYFKYNGINQPNRNRLLFRDKTIDGIKTGHTKEAGYCLVSSSVRDGMRLIAVVMGTNSEEARATESQKLLSYGFRYFETHKVYGKEEVVTEASVWKGLSNTINLGITQDLYLTIPRGSSDALEAKAQIDKNIEAPIILGQEFGEITVSLKGEELIKVPMVAQAPVDEAGFFSRLWDGILLFFKNLL